MQNKKVLWLGPPSLDLLEVEHVAVEVREDVALKRPLLAVGGEVLGADGAHLPVGLQVALQAALLKVRREDDLAEWAAPLGLAAPWGDGRERERGGGEVSVLVALSQLFPFEK